MTEASPDFDEPEPDDAVTVESYLHYATRRPRPADLVLVIEASDSTLRFDMNSKASLYARAGIRDFWCIDVQGRRLIVHRNPAAGGCGDVMIYGADEPVSPLARPTDTILVSSLLPPR